MVLVIPRDPWFILCDQMAEEGRILSLNIGILVFNNAEEMDFVGPWEVLKAATEYISDHQVMLIAETTEQIVCEKGMRVIPDFSYSDAPRLDVIVVPGGSGARAEISNAATVSWLVDTARQCQWITSVCTGAFLLVGSGVVQNHQVTTHHDFIEQLKDMHDGDVIERVRLVRDRHVVTSGGVMSGIEMCLWLVKELFGPATEEHTRSYIAYDFPPRSKLKEIR